MYFSIHNEKKFEREFYEQTSHSLIDIMTEARVQNENKFTAFTHLPLNGNEKI